MKDILYFHYFGENKIIRRELKREDLFNYLNQMSSYLRLNENVLCIAPPENRVSEGIILVQSNTSQLESVCKYVFSEKRIILPEFVTSENKNYQIIENVLKEEQGDSAKLKWGFFNQRRISL